MEESDDFKLAVKVVIKRQMKDLMEQLRERGEEIAVLTVDLEDNSFSHFGSPNGEWFLSQEKNIPQSFLNFCQSNTNQRASQTTVTSISPKKKSIASLRSASKQNTSSSTEVPELRVTIPKKLAGDLSEDEVAALVGRIVATHLAFQEKGDGSSSGTQFDVLLKAANQSKHKGLSSILSTPRSSRKRKPTAKFMEGMSSLKKSRKIDDDEFNEMEIGNEEMFGLLSELSNTVLKRVKVTVPNNKTINLEKYSLDTSDSTEALAVYIIQELDAVCGSQLANRNSIKVSILLDIENRDDKVHVEIGGVSIGRVKSEDMDDSDMEYLDLDGQNENFNEEEEDFDDPDFNVKEIVKLVNSSGIRGNISTGRVRVSLPSKPLKRKKKQLKPLSERMPMPCEHCGIHLAGKSNLKSHIRRVHLKVKDKKCSICNKGFWSLTARESHMLSVHTRRCENCQEYVVESVPWNPGMDMRMKRDVICTCGSIVSIFSSFGRRRQYLRDDEPDEDGNLPETQSKSKSNIGTKYACGICGKLFMKKSNCERHSRAHTDFKGVGCEICGSHFTYESSLKKHLQSEHGIVGHVCEICGKNYSNETALKVHYVKYHAEENFTIGENVVMIVKEKANDTTDLSQQMEEIMEGENEETEMNNGGLGEVKGHLVVSEDGGQVVVTHGEGGQLTLTTADGHPVGETEAAQIVQQVIHDGQVVGQEGNMSIIIKQIPVSEME